MNDEQYATQTEHKSVLTLVTECKNKQINLSPPYQRDVEWSSSKQQGYINSVYSNIIPTPIIININIDNEGIQDCIDGKQRITSLINFVSNKIYLEWNGKKVFYNKIPIAYKNDSYCITFTKNELIKFNNRSIMVIKYNGLAYEEQVDIFQRIQFGKKVSKSQLIMSIFKTEQICKIFKEFVNRNIHLLDEYNEKILLLIDIICVINKGFIIVEKKQRNKFLQEFNTLLKMKTMITQVEPTLQWYLSDNIFNNELLKACDESLILHGIFWCEKYNIGILKKMDYNELQVIIFNGADEMNEYLGKQICSFVKKWNNQHDNFDNDSEEEIITPEVKVITNKKKVLLDSPEKEKPPVIKKKVVKVIKTPVTKKKIFVG